VTKVYEKIRFFWDVTPQSATYLSNYMVLIPRWKQSSQSPPWEHQFPQRVTHTERV